MTHKAILNVETTASVASPLWHPKSTTQSSHLTSANDVQSSENQVFWPPKQNDQHSSHTCSSGVWSSVSHLFRESTEDNKNALLQSARPNYHSPVSSSRASSCLDQVQPMKRSENGSTCRLFGIDLRNNENKISLSGKEASFPRPNTISDNDAPLKRSETEGTQNGDLMMKERNNVQLELSPTDVKGKVSSSRTRIKVRSRQPTVYIY